LLILRNIVLPRNKNFKQQMIIMSPTLLPANILYPALGPGRCVVCANRVSLTSAISVVKHGLLAIVIPLMFMVVAIARVGSKIAQSCLATKLLMHRILCTFSVASLTVIVVVVKALIDFTN